MAEKTLLILFFLIKNQNSANNSSSSYIFRDSHQNVLPLSDYTLSFKPQNPLIRKFWWQCNIYKVKAVASQG